MRYFTYILFFVTIISCDNLDRNNPIDAHQDDYTFVNSEESETEKDSSITGSDFTGINPNSPNVFIKSATILSEDFADGVINAGEKVKMAFTLENNGSGDALGVQVLFSCYSIYVNNFKPNTWVTYSSSNLSSEPNIYAQTTATAPLSSDEIEFEVSSNAQGGSELKIELIIKDDHGNTWKQNFKTIIQDPPPIVDVQFSKYHVSYEEFSDGVISRGEDIRIRPYIINRGTVMIYQPQITITSSNPYVNIPYSYSNKSLFQWDNSDGWLIFPGMEARPIFTSGNFRFNVSELAPSPCEVEFNVIIEDAVNRIFLDTFKITVY
tara:strand:+ start:3944 stop:4909 length:966 start_codon:yes stop_codon:yes gene_type:complete